MLLQIRVRLADRPGSLGRVTSLLGALGVDIRQVIVLGRESGRAVDDFTVELPGSVSKDRLVDTLQNAPGVVVEGVWPATAVPGASWDVAVLGQVAANPDHGYAILVDAAPRLFGAHWAALVATGGTVRYASVGAPDRVPVPEPLRARAYDAGDGHRCAVAPFGPYTSPQHALLVARIDAPGFHVAELDRMLELVGAVDRVLADRSVSVVTP